jgi:diguanylate cyclase (GGDEF)-like protein
MQAQATAPSARHAAQLMPADETGGRAALPLTSAVLERRALELTSLLQSSLEIEKLVELFSAELNRLVPHKGLAFIASGEDYTASVGEPGGYSCDYDIVLAASSIGHIVMWRGYAFNDEETKTVEGLLVALAYPLRNALLYRRALATALTDPLTGINNRAAMNVALEREVGLAQRHGIALSLILVDIDHFKQVNDEFGHLTGDDVLRRVAKCIADCIRRSDIVFRYGGEEFAIVLTNTGLFGAALLAQRIRAAVERLAPPQDGAYAHVTVSAGVSVLEAGDCALDLIAKADQALYQAKSQGRNQVVEYAA